MAFIEPDVSVTSITDAFSTGTATVASGRASAMHQAGERQAQQRGRDELPRAAGAPDDRGAASPPRGSGST